MAITGPGSVSRAERVYAQQTRRAPTASALRGSSSADHVQISEQARQMSLIDELKTKLDGLPEIRQDLVNDARAEIQAGTYETPEKLDIAVDRLLGEMLGD